MTYICSWCGKELPGYHDNGDQRESHGICVPCAIKQLPARLAAQFLDAVDTRRRETLQGKGAAA